VTTAAASGPTGKQSGRAPFDARPGCAISRESYLDQANAWLRRDSIFIPWLSVCADAAVSSTLSCRRSNAIAKMLAERRAETGPACLAIDDLNRTSRDRIESLRLGELPGETGVRIIGASNGFHGAGQQSARIMKEAVF
jgi:hypothetical protein